MLLRYPLTVSSCSLRRKSFVSLLLSLAGCLTQIGSNVNFFLETNNLLLIGIAVSSGLLLIWPLIQQSRGGKVLAAAQVIQMMNHQNGLVVDIRPLATYQNGHIADSRNLPLADFATKAADLPKNRPLILACDRGQSAISAATKLRRLGFNDVVVLQGGINAWAQAGLPLSTKR